jgi:hypothetical protein
MSPINPNPNPDSPPAPVDPALAEPGQAQLDDSASLSMVVFAEPGRGKAATPQAICRLLGQTHDRTSTGSDNPAGSPMSDTLPMGHGGRA